MAAGRKATGTVAKVPDTLERPDRRRCAAGCDDTVGCGELIRDRPFGWPQRVFTALVVVFVVTVAARPAPPAVGLAPGATRPTPTPLSSSEPLGEPPAAPHDDRYAFVATQDDGVTPVTYDPCRPIHVVVNDAMMPASAEGLIAEALAAVSAATGLVFDEEGVTDESSAGDRAAFQPERYGDRWAPVLISWSDPSRHPKLGSAVGVGGSIGIQMSDGRWVFVTGEVHLDGPEFAEMHAEGVERDAARAVIMHELGHLVGLSHVDDPTQLMHRAAHLTHGEFSQGDLAGLARLGAGDCMENL